MKFLLNIKQCPRTQPTNFCISWAWFSTIFRTSCPPIPCPQNIILWRMHIAGTREREEFLFHTPLSTVERWITGNTPLRCLVVEAQLLQAVHQVVQPLPLLVDDLPVICQGVEQSLSLRDYQTPAETRARDRDETILCTWVTAGKQTPMLEWFWLLKLEVNLQSSSAHFK